MKGLDFWATDAWTDGVLPIFDEWSTTFLLQEWTREVMRDEIMHAMPDWSPKLWRCDLSAMSLWRR